MSDSRESYGDLEVERYKFILQQLHSINENVYKLLAIYQALAVTLGGAALALMVGYEEWGIRPSVARTGVVGLMTLVSTVALFVVLLIAAGVASWLDYRREECELTDSLVGPGFRQPANPKNFLRWYETYVALFILVTAISAWIAVVTVILPVIR
jgi:hypothetical protein